MPTAKSNYGPITAPDLIENEPVHILRASDGPAVVALITVARVLQEKDREHDADEAFDAAMEMSEWQRENPEKVHVLKESRETTKGRKKGGKTPKAD